MAKVILMTTLTLISFVSIIFANSMVIDGTGNNNSLTATSENQGGMKALEIDLMDIMNECNESFRIEMSYLDALNKSGSFPDETDKTPKCYIRCVLEKTGVASAEGEFDSQRAAMVFVGDRGGEPVDDLEEIAELCGNRRESCKCEKSYNYMKCLMTMEIAKYGDNRQINIFK